MADQPKGLTPQEMQAKSNAKLKQITDLMALLHLRVEARQHIDQNGFIQNVVFWSDDEKYVPAPAAPAAPEGPTGGEEAGAQPETAAVASPFEAGETGPTGEEDAAPAA